MGDINGTPINWADVKTAEDLPVTTRTGDTITWGGAFDPAKSLIVVKNGLFYILACRVCGKQWNFHRSYPGVHADYCVHIADGGRLRQ